MTESISIPSQNLPLPQLFISNVNYFFLFPLTTEVAQIIEQLNDKK